MSAALVASSLGVAGTLIGAAVASVVSTVCAAYYTHIVDAARIRLGKRARGDIPATAASTAAAKTAAVKATAAQPLTPSGDPDGDSHKPRGSWWYLRAPYVAAIGIFVVAVAVITILEYGLGHPISNSEQKGTSVGHVIRQEPATPAPSAPAPAPKTVVPTTVAPTGSPAPTSSGVPSTATSTNGTAMSSAERYLPEAPSRAGACSSSLPRPLPAG